MSTNIRWEILIFSVCISVVFGLPQSDKKYSQCNIGQKLNHTDRNGRLKYLVCTKTIKGVPQWKFVDGSPTLGEIFDPARDCSDIVDQLPEAKDGFYWIVLPKGNEHKIWCDVHTDRGGFALVGMQDSPVSWTVPSNPTPVDPQGPPHWSSDLGDLNFLDFRVQVSTDKSFEGTKADWFYRVEPKRELGNLSSLGNGCPYFQAGIGNISFVKDLLTDTVFNKFKCSKFGPHIHHLLGWGKMNYCLRNRCDSGYAISDAFKFRYDNFGSYSYSAVSSVSGINHNSTAFVGCDNNKCCACFGPKGGRENYCGSTCTPINGGTVSSKAFVWFWVRNRMPVTERLWKRCMEFQVTNPAGKLENRFIDPRTGIARKGYCSIKRTSYLNEGTLTIFDKESFEKIPDVPGLISYRADIKKLYVNEGSKWEALCAEQEFQQLKTEVENKENITNTKIQKQETKIQSQETKLQSQETKIQIQETKIQSQETKIQSQEIKLQSQGSLIIELQKQIQDIMNRTERLHSPESCSALLKKYPSSTSGMYYINPQGLGSSSLVQVYCDMTSKNGVGVTVIGHDSESRTYVKGYDREGSYQRNIKYDISMEQIVAIMNQSENCEQFIKYECYHSMLVRNTNGWWVSRQGSQMNYWGGAAVNSGKCACGMTNSCPIQWYGNGWECNCDANDATWREDSGYLTDKNTLPVAELRFGDTGTYDGVDEKGYHTLGKLRCWN